jgi:hypothetical protein
MKLSEGATAAERAQLESWLTNAFETYSCKMDDTDRRALRALQEEFIRLVQETERTLVRQDLVRLMKAGCSAQNIGELLLVPLAFGSPTVKALDEVGITTNNLRNLKAALRWMPEIINTLVLPNFPGPLCMLRDCFPDKKEQQRVRRSINGIPEALGLLAVLMKNYPPKADSELEKFAERKWLLTLYLLLTHYGSGGPTLSGLVQIMRQAVRTVSPDTEYLPRTNSLESRALEKRLRRFCKDYPTAKLDGDMLMEYFMRSPEKRKGIGILEFHERQRGEEENSEANVEWLTEALKLTQQQRTQLSSIFEEEDKRIAQSFIALTSRRTRERIFPNVLAHKRVDKELTEIGQYVEEQIRRILDSAQRERYELLLKEQEEVFAREMAKMRGPSS